VLQDSLSDQMKVEQCNENVNRADENVKSCDDQVTALNAVVNCYYANCVILVTFFHFCH